MTTQPLPDWRDVDLTTEPYAIHTELALSLLKHLPDERDASGKPTGKCSAYHYTYIGGVQAVIIDVIDYGKPKHPRKVFEQACDDLAMGTVLAWLAMREWLETTP